jgi:uncharacterized membrane protein affecting hemolysin expression
VEGESPALRHAIEVRERVKDSMNGLNTLGNCLIDFITNSTKQMMESETDAVALQGLAKTLGYNRTILNPIYDIVFQQSFIGFLTGETVGDD